MSMVVSALSMAESLPQKMKLNAALPAKLEKAAGCSIWVTIDC